MAGNRDPRINIAYYLKREDAEADAPKLEDLPEGAMRVDVELEPDKGWIIVVHSIEKINKRYADGLEWRDVPPAPASSRRSSRPAADAAGGAEEDERTRERRERRRLRRAARKRAQGR